MRISRSVQLHPTSGMVHQFWRCHNREFYLSNPAMKSLYLQALKDALKTHNKEGVLKIYSYTCMGNHFHNLMNYTNGSRKLSNYLRQAHSLFGARYNRFWKRSGKVAEGRPKTSLIENTEHEMKVHFYIEANPVRAGICTEAQLRSYKYSSYRFYAYGIRDSFSEILTIPDWYIKLGATARLRQKKYRILFLDYLRKGFDRTEFFAPFIGSPIWMLLSLEKVKELIKLSTTQTISTA